MSSAPNKSTGWRIGLRLGLFYAVCFLIGYAAILVAADFLIRASIEEGEREVVCERLAEYRAWYRTGQGDNLQARFDEQRRRSVNPIFVRLSGQGIDILLPDSLEADRLVDLAQLDELAAAGEPITETITTRNPPNVWTVATTPLPDGRTLQAGRLSTTAYNTVTVFRRISLLTMIPGVLLSLAGGVFLAHRVMKPVRDLTATVAAIIDTGDLDRRVEVGRSSPALADMGILFNRMLERNQALIRAMRESLDNVAHDLRTPMARLRATAEQALFDVDNPAGARDALADCMEESERVLTMLNTLMDISEAESGAMLLQTGEVDLVSLVEQVAELYQLVAEERAITIETTLPDSLPVEGDRVRLQQVFANLVDNAVKYAPDHGRVAMTADRDGDAAVIRVSDDGPGIPETDLPRIWERLYRGDQSRSQRGLGLGLSFVRAIIDAHGGSVEVRSTPGKGSRFEIRLPTT